MKVALRDDPETPDRGLSLISTDLPRELIGQYEPSIMRQLKDAQESAEEDSHGGGGGNQLLNSEGISIGDRRKKLKYANFDAGITSHRYIMLWFVEKIHARNIKCIPFFTPLPSFLFLVVSCFCAACLREEFGGWGPFYLIADLRVFSVWCMLA